MSSVSDFLVQRLSSVSPLSAADRRAIAQLPFTVRRLRADADIVVAGVNPGCCRVLVEGIARRYRTYPGHGRQIIGFHQRGDLLDVESLHLRRGDCAVAAVTPVEIGEVPHDALRAAALANPGLAQAVWREVLIDGAVLRESLARIGRHLARERVAHLICEFYLRAQAAGLVGADGCAFPLTQPEMGDALGLTPIHVNRVLRALRDEGALSLSMRRLRIPDWGGLCAIANFNPTYLHLWPDCGPGDGETTPYQGAARHNAQGWPPEGPTP